MAKQDDSTTTPTSEEIATLPRWARVAFAGRCARRVVSLFETSSHASQKDITAVHDAIDAGEIAAASAASDVAASDAAAFAATSAADAVRAADAADPAANAADAAVFAAASAADAAAFAAHATSATSAAVCATDAADAIRAVRHAAYAGAWTIIIADAMRHDFESLRAAARRHNWTDDTGVAPSFFGSLWPDGEPEGWPIASDAPVGERLHRPSSAESPVFEIYIDPGRASKETLQDVFEALSDLHMACGGLGLEFRTDDLSVYAVDTAQS